MTALLTPGQSTAERDRLERELLRSMDGVADEFLQGVYEDARDALDSPVLLAAADPFAYTNIMKRWRTAIRTLADQELDQELLDVLESSNFPDHVYQSAVDVLTRRRESGWTVYWTKVQLGKALIPAKGSEHKNQVRMMARTAATRTHNRRIAEHLALGVRKRWVAHHDARTRADHREADGQTVDATSSFLVGGHAMQYPGDNGAPIEQTANCRCVLAEVTTTMPDMTMTAAAPPAITNPKNTTAAATASVATWSGVLAVEGPLTGDGRMIEPGALRWDSLPLKLRYVKEDVGEHANAVVVGLITEIMRSGAQILGKGTIDLGSVEGREVYRLMGGESEDADPLVDGVSIDLDDIAFEIRVKQEILDQQQAFMDALMSDEEPLPEDIPKEVDAEGRVTVMEARMGDEVMVTVDARVRAATLVAIPAFEEARITLDSRSQLSAAPPAADAEADEDEDDESTTTTTRAPEDEDADEEADDEEFGKGKKKKKRKRPHALIAAGIPIRPPAKWFADPKLSGPTPIHITEDGRVYGHLAAWGTCHIAHPECVSPPSSPSNYAYFRTGSVLTAEGELIPTGRITMDTGHADPKFNHLKAMAHYDNTGTGASDLAAGEDEWGIWVAGALRPRINAEKRRVLRGSPLSGDWRRIGGQLELIAALAVNVPGFPIPHTSGLVASGQMESLVASGLVLDETLASQEYHANVLSSTELRRLQRIIAADREREAKGFARRVNKIKVGRMARQMGRI